MKKLLLFGAGKIGRSFIAQLFSRSEYEVVFADIDENIISLLNSRGSYDVIIKSDAPDKVLHIDNVRGILATDKAGVAGELADCDIAAVSVGQKGLAALAPAIAAGLKLRREKYRDRPLDIIIAENLRNADAYMRELLLQNLPEDYPVEKLVGLVETSIGKMVPIMPAAEQATDPLKVYAEPYNTLILGSHAFRNPVPAVEGLAPKDNIKAWVDRKSYIHNFGHAAAAYLGYSAHPGATYLWEVLDDPDVLRKTKAAMQQSAAILRKKYPAEFTTQDTDDHIEDLLSRFRNKALGDTVFRIGSDLSRKLYRKDRVSSPLLDGIRMGMPVDLIAEVFVNGLRFRAVDENGKMLPSDVIFAQTFDEKGVRYLLQNVCGITREENPEAWALLT